MIIKTVTYTDFNGQQSTDTLHFHLNTAEVTRIMAKVGGDIEAFAKQLAGSGDTEKMIAFIEDLILQSYGVKSADGKKFIKNAEIRSDFENSIAYAELFTELLLNPDQTKEFAEGLVMAPGYQQPKTQPQLTVAKSNTEQSIHNTLNEAAQPEVTSKSDILKTLADNPELFSKLEELVSNQQQGGIDAGR